MTMLLLPILVSVSAEAINGAIGSVERGEPADARILSVSRTRPSGDSWLFAEQAAFSPTNMDDIVAAMEARSHESMRARGAVDPLAILVALLVQGRQQAGVTLTDIVVDGRCEEPLRGALIHAPTPGGGPMSNPRMVFDLDQPNAAGRSVNQDGRLGDEYFRGNSIHLARDEQVVVVVELRTRRHYCSPSIAVEASDGEASQLVAVSTEDEQVAVSGFLDGSASAEEIGAFGGYDNLYRYANGALTPTSPDQLSGAR